MDQQGLAGVLLPPSLQVKRAAVEQLTAEIRRRPACSVAYLPELDDDKNREENQSLEEPMPPAAGRGGRGQNGLELGGFEGIAVVHVTRLETLFEPAYALCRCAMSETFRHDAPF